MANYLKTEKRLTVLRLLCEGCSIRYVSRVTGVHKGTIGKLILGFGNACRTFLDEKLQGLKLRHVEVDEIWTFCGKKQGRLTTGAETVSGTVIDAAESVW